MKHVVVIGAGITGCAAALYLTRASSGVRVTVLDATGPGQGSSTQTAGNLHFQLSYSAMKEGEEAFRRHVRVIGLNRDADQRWQELAAELPSLRVYRSGGVVVAETDDDVAELRRKVRLEREAGFDTEFLDADDVRRIVPELSSDILGASWHAREGYVDAKTACYVLAKAATRAGATFLTGAFVQRVTAAGDGWAVELADDRELLADRVVVAVGAWTGSLLARSGGHVPMHLDALTMSVCDRAARVMDHLVMHATRPLSVKQVSSGNVMIGGGRPAQLVPDEGPLEWQTAPRLDSILAGMADAARVVPATAGLEVIRSWTGILGSPADELPVVGELSELPGVVVAVAGHTGYTLGPTMGWAAARQALGEDPGLDLAPFSPARFAMSGAGR